MRKQKRVQNKRSTPARPARRKSVTFWQAVDIIAGGAQYLAQKQLLPKAKKPKRRRITLKDIMKLMP